MPRIRCRYEDCVFLESGYCTAERIELDPEMGCLTYQQADEEVAVVEEDWAADEETELAEEEDEDEEEEEEIDWEDDDEDEDEDNEDEW
ncbi:MAG TPA: hypothetical protein VIK33_20725 [Anaerolineae bacterium]